MGLNAAGLGFDSDRTPWVPSSLPPSGGADWAGAPALSCPSPARPRCRIPPMSSPRPVTLRRRMLGLIAVVGIVAAACQSTGPSPAPSAAAVPSPSAAVDPALAGPVRTGVAGRPVEDATPRSSRRSSRSAASRRSSRSTRSSSTTPASRRSRPRASEKDNPKELVDANERLLKGLGLLAADAYLGDLYVELLGEQVAGLYSPDDKALYVVSRSGQPRSDREDHVRPRVHPRAAGPELRPLDAQARRGRRG